MEAARVEMFRKCVTMIFNNWTALRLAAEHHIGFPQGKEMALKFVDHIVEVFTSKDNVEWEEAADILEDVMDSQFETFCDDDSAEEVGTILCQVYVECMEGDLDEVESEMSLLPKCEVWLSKPVQSPNVAKEENPTDEQGKQSVSSEPMEVIDEEWTQVKGRRKKDRQS